MKQSVCDILRFCLNGIKTKNLPVIRYICVMAIQQVFSLHPQKTANMHMLPP